uniref:uncharacterized protein LOC120343861 n=1 Tax=Styela clava TaxID=7725 RepID=UPI00193AC15E|nr:uncharacterized protein LOC120343861 [Styela clava]
MPEKTNNILDLSLFYLTIYLSSTGEKCWTPMLCNNIPVWKVFRECGMNEELRNRKKALEEQITLLEGKLKIITARTTQNNIIHTSATDVEETTKPQEFDNVKTSSVTVIPQTTSEPAVQTIPSGFTEQDIVRYGGRIFIPLASEAVGKASAIDKCQQINGDLANIYNQDHMEKIITFIRDNKMDGEERKFFHLGMKYDPATKILRFHNGTVISQSDFKWYDGYPENRQGNDWTNMFIDIRSHYFFNHPDTAGYVLCEI